MILQSAFNSIHTLTWAHSLLYLGPGMGGGLLSLIIMILGNDMIRSDDYARMLYPNSHIYIYNFKNGAIDTSYNKVLQQ